MNAKFKKKLTPYGYLLPTIILMMILLVIPIVMVIDYSLYDNVIANKNPVFVGLSNYAPRSGRRSDIRFSSLS